MPAPTPSEAQTYLNPATTQWTLAEITSAFNSEKAAQSRSCRTPATRTAVVATTNGSATVTATADTFTTRDVGGDISGTGVPAGATITALVSATEVVISANATATGTPTATLVEFWSPDLVEALFRRTAHNLALRALPLGVQANVTDAAVATTRVGGTDAEVRRLEAPFRRLVFG